VQKAELFDRGVVINPSLSARKKKLIRSIEWAFLSFEERVGVLTLASGSEIPRKLACRRADFALSPLSFSTNV
jgi:hypothetical protein